MESGNGGASSKGVLIPVSERSDAFKNCILAPLQSAYLYEESKQCFRYKSAAFVNNPALEEKYNSFRAKRREEGYSEEDLKETYGFLLFDDVSKAHALGETGLLSGNSTCTTLGDPSKGVYISMYSDCLDLNRWYHGKSGYIAIIRLTKGRFKKVFENYTQNFTAPSPGFDCHVSEELPSVSAKTSSFLAFERTQYYMYELVDDGSNETVQSPSAACPFAVVSFSYTDTTATLLVPQEKSVEEKPVHHYLSWRGQLQIGTQFYSIGLRSTARALITGKLPPLVKVDRAISMLVLRELLPKAVFETCLSGEVFLNELYYSLCEFVSSDAEETNSLSLLLQEIKEKDLALPVSLKDGGFLILLHSSHFLSYDDASEILQGIFVFPESRQIQRDTKFGQRKAALSSEILRILPVLSYAEAEIEKTTIEPSEDLCELLVQHMQSYAALINPGLTFSPSRDISIFPDQYDVPDAHKHLYASPEWTDNAWQSFRSYLNKPLSFQLPVSKAFDILAAGQEERSEDLDDDVYICLSSPEEPLADSVSMESENESTVQKSPVNVETSVDDCAEAQDDITAVTQNELLDWDAGYAAKDMEKSDLTVLIKKDDVQTKNLLTLPTDDLPAELIVSITSAKRTDTDESLGVISTVSAKKHNDFDLSDFSAAKLQSAGVNSFSIEAVKIINGDYAEVTKLKKTKRRKRSRINSKRQRKTNKVVIQATSLQTVKPPLEDTISVSQKDDLNEELSNKSWMKTPSNTDWRKLRRRKRIYGKTSKYKVLRSATVGPLLDPGQEKLEGAISLETEVFTLRKKTERWDLKPVVSECGKILVPYGSVDFAGQIKSLKDKVSMQSTNDEEHSKTNLVDAPVEACNPTVDSHDTTLDSHNLFVDSHDTTMDANDSSVNAHDTVEMEQESSTASETEMEKSEFTTSNDAGHNFQNTAVSDINPEHNLLSQPDDGKGSLPLNPENCGHFLRNGATDTAPSVAVNEKPTDILSTVKSASKGAFLFSKLKSVLLRGKRKTDIVTSDDVTADAEPGTKKGKVDYDNEPLKHNYAIANVQDIGTGAKKVSEMLSLDPFFAYALGLTPKEKPDNVQKTVGQNTRLKTDSSETQKHTIIDKQPQNKQMKSIFTRRARIKTLKKHQGIPTEYVKKKWWLHFQTPACFPSEKVKCKESTRGNSVRKTVKEKMNSACSSTDALNLLADLALSANNGQVPPQPGPAHERKPETSLKKCDLTKDVTSAEQKSVLHGLLRQPAARPIESPSPSHLVGGSKLGDFISKEHAYSLPPSSSLLLGLPGTPFQVSPLSGSTRLLHHHQQLYGNGIQTLHPSVCQEDRNEHNRTPEYLKKQMVHRHKFRYSRTFVNKNGSIEVTRQWKENYDFILDSKFTSDSKDRTVIRALHGPWNFSIQDTIEEVRLIVHMWIGLFYSRTTDRLFHIDSNFTNPCPDESDSLEMVTRMTTAPSESELRGNSFAQPPTGTDTSESSVSKALDLSKKDNYLIDEGAVILDLSLGNSNAESVSSAAQINRNKTPVSSESTEASESSNTFKSFVELHMASAFQSYTNITHSTEGTNKANDGRSIGENGNTCRPLQRTTFLEYTDGLPFKGHGLFIAPFEDMQNLCSGPRKVETSSPAEHEKKNVKDGNSGNTESLVQRHATDSSKSVTDKTKEPEKEVEDMVHSIDGIEFDNGENSKMREKLCKEGNMEPSLTAIHTDDGSTNKDLSIVCNGHCLENVKPLSRIEPKAASPGQAENADEVVDCCTIKDKINGGIDCLEKKDELDEKGRYISSVEVHSDWSDEPLLTICKSPDQNQPSDKQSPQMENEQDASHNVLSAKGSSLTVEHTISETVPQSLSEMGHIQNEPVKEENSKNNCVADKEDSDHKSALPSDESTGSFDGSCVAVSLPQTKDSVETGSQHMDKANLRYDLSTNQETKSFEQKENDVATHKEPFHHQSHSTQYEVINKCDNKETLSKDTDLKMDKPNEAFEKSFIAVVIPFIGLDISRDDIAQQQGKVEELQNNIPFISETACPDLPLEVSSISQHNKKKELSSGTLSGNDLSKTNQLVVLGTESDDRCPTPTMDEKPYEFILHSGCSSTTCRNSTQKCCIKSTTPVKEDMPPDLKSTVNKEPSPHGLNPDLEERTLKVLRSLDEFLSKPNHTGTSSQMETTETKHSIVPTPSTSGKDIPTCFSSSKNIPTCLSPNHTSADFKGKKITSNSTSELLTEPSEHFVLPPFKSKLEEVLGVKLKLNKTFSSFPQHYSERTGALQEMSVGQSHHPLQTSFSPEFLQVIKPKMEENKHKTSQSTLNNELPSCSHCPDMAVKSSKSDESRADSICKDEQSRNSPSRKWNKNPASTHTTPTSTETTKRLLGNSEELNHGMHLANELFFRNSWTSSVSNRNSDLGKAKRAHLDPSHHYQRRDISKCSASSDQSMQSPSFHSTEGSSKLVHRNQSYLIHGSVEKFGQTAKENASHPSASFLNYRNNSITYDSLTLGPECSLMCTVYNNNRKRCYSFLEQVSKRCLQDDLTQASMEQEHLIFHEQMKQLLKKSKRAFICQQDVHEKMPLSCVSPVTVNFSSLEEHEDLLDHLGKAPSLVGRKFKVVMSDRKDLANTTETEMTLCPQKTGNTVEHAGVSSVTEECARLYETMMNDVCAVKKLKSRSKYFSINRNNPKTELCNNFDFCDQMKKEMDKSFHSHLNSVVKKSCKTKYRFYILVTSDDVFFEETKAQLETQGHTAVMSSEFLLDEDSSSLLIILRNEDIAEHICEVPHLLELKKSPNVQFAGIDEPDDVVNLTHQELFTRGGFIMFDRATLEPLNLSNMKKCSDILQQLGRTGKWKWMLHYRDSRRLKENARLSAEAKEKVSFLNWCQDAGLLEVLPYHDCDLVSKHQPDYLTCLVRLQIQNISARYSVFISDSEADAAFRRNGILTMSVDTFWSKSPV